MTNDTNDNVWESYSLPEECPECGEDEELNAVVEREGVVDGEIVAVRADVLCDECFHSWRHHAPGWEHNTHIPVATPDPSPGHWFYENLTPDEVDSRDDDESQIEEALEEADIDAETIEEDLRQSDRERDGDTYHDRLGIPITPKRERDEEIFGEEVTEHLYGYSPMESARRWEANKCISEEVMDYFEECLENDPVFETGEWYDMEVGWLGDDVTFTMENGSEVEYYEDWEGSEWSADTATFTVENDLEEEGTYVVDGKRMEPYVSSAPVGFTATFEDTGDARKLTDLPGIGYSKRDRLVEAGYHTVEKVREASQGELAQVPGIGNALSARIKAQVGDAPSETMGKTNERSWYTKYITDAGTKIYTCSKCHGRGFGRLDNIEHKPECEKE